LFPPSPSPLPTPVKPFVSTNETEGENVEVTNGGNEPETGDGVSESKD
jgi:hypothetical protein